MKANMFTNMGAGVVLLGGAAGASVAQAFVITGALVVSSLTQPALTPVPPPPPQTVHVTIDQDGVFSPRVVDINSGDTVQWDFFDAADSIIPAIVGIVPAECPPILGYDPFDANDVTGPLPQAVPGIFSLSPDNDGYRSTLFTCWPTSEVMRIGNERLCTGGGYQSTMATTWEDPTIDGVFIRLRWSDLNPGPGVYDFTILDREVDQAVTHGKLYSLGIKAGGPAFAGERSGTPDWIFSTNPDGTVRAGGGVTRLHFVDHGGGPNEVKPGNPMDLGDPGEQAYRTLYFDTLSAVAEHLLERADRFRALAYIKLSGANLFTHENRLPGHCPSANRCSPATWASAGYTPDELYVFYDQQGWRLDEELPTKTLSYALIQAGFPIVSNAGAYLDSTGAVVGPVVPPLPGDIEQTNHIINEGQDDHGERWAVQHNGLGPDLAPNDLVVREGGEGQPTGFQTNNPDKVRNSVELDDTLTNLEATSDGVFLEIYEQRLWEASRKNGGVLDPSKPVLLQRTLRDWSDLLYARQRALFPTLPDPRPLSWSRLLTRTNPIGPQYFYYRHGSKCGNGASQYGTIVVH